MDVLDIAHPTLTLALVVALLVTLGLLTNINRRLRVSEHRIQSLESEQKLYDEALALANRIARTPAPIMGPPVASTPMKPQLEKRELLPPTT